MTTRSSEPTSGRRKTGDLLLRLRPAADRTEVARPPLAPDPRRHALPASLLFAAGEPLPSDYYLG